MSIAWLGWGRASGGSASAEHRTHSVDQRGLSSPKRRSGLERPRTATAMNSSDQRRDGTALVSAAVARNRTASANQSHATQSGGRAVNLCARDWQGNAGNRRGIARPRTATAMVGPAPLCHASALQGSATALQGHDMLCDCSVEQCGAWHGEEMPLRRQGAADIGAQTQRTTNYPFRRGAGLKSALRRATRERMDEWA